MSGKLEEMQEQLDEQNITLVKLCHKLGHYWSADYQTGRPDFVVERLRREGKPETEEDKLKCKTCKVRKWQLNDFPYWIDEPEGRR